MALVASALGGLVTVSFTVSSSGNVTAVDMANGSAQSVTVDVVRTSSSVVSQSLGPGASTTSNIPKGKQFSYSASTSDWSVSVTVG